MLPKIFEGAKVGDEVFSVRDGWTKISRIAPDVQMFLTASDWFFMTGQLFKTDVAPTCFPAHLVPQYYLDICPRPKRKVVKEIKGLLMLSAHGNIVGFVDSIDDAWTGLKTAPFTGTYEVEE